MIKFYYFLPIFILLLTVIPSSEDAYADLYSEVQDIVSNGCDVGSPPKGSIQGNYFWAIESGDYLVYDFFTSGEGYKFNVGSVVLVIMGFSPDKSAVLVWEYDSVSGNIDCSWKTLDDGIFAMSSNSSVSNVVPLHIFPVKIDNTSFALSVSDEFAEKNGVTDYREFDEKRHYDGLGRSVSGGGTVNFGTDSIYLEPTKEGQGFSLHPTTGLWTRSYWNSSGPGASIGQLAELSQVKSVNVPTVKVTEGSTNTGLKIYADAVLGSTTIDISGWTDRVSQDITLTVTAPNGNVISITQVSPMFDGQFTSVITTGGSLWKQDGFYTVTAQQFNDPNYTASTEVEIADGVVVPEFGTIAAMILAVAIISIIVVSARSRLSIIPR